MKSIYNLIFLSLICVFLSSCRSSDNSINAHNSPIDSNIIINPRPIIISDNAYDLVIQEQSIEYTIDISTPDGRMKLNGVSLEQAQQIVTNAALMKYNCDVIVHPKYDPLVADDGQILRITVVGRAAIYRNKQVAPQPTPVMESSPNNGKSVIINVNN